MKHCPLILQFIFTSIRIIIKLVFNIKDGNRLELQTPEAIKIFGNTKKLIGKTKNGENVTSLKQKAYEKLDQELMKISRNNDHTTGNLLDYSYHQN